MTKEDLIAQIKARIAQLTGIVEAMELIKNPDPIETIKTNIHDIATKVGVEEDLVLRIIGCESNFDMLACNENNDGSIDRGICQINDLAHPEVSNFQAYDYVFSVQWMCEQIKAGNVWMWNSSKKCWAK